MAKHYTKEHEWVEMDGEEAVIGISEHAAHELGDITYVELPKVGKSVKQFETLAGIESVKAASDIYAPVAGKVARVNEKLDETPELVNQSAEGEGWICRLEGVDPSGLGELMDAAAYAAYLKGL